MSKQSNVFDRNGVIIECQPVEAVAIYDQFENSHVAHVKQSIVSKYPTRRFNNRLSSGLFSADEGEYTEFESTRHTLVKVPNTLASANEADLLKVQSQLDQFPGTIQRIVSHNLDDVLTEGDEWALENVDEITRDTLEDRYETRDSENNRYSSGKLRVSAADGVVDETLPKEFSRRVYQNMFVEDKDLRKGSIGTHSAVQEEDVDAEIQNKLNP